MRTVFLPWWSHGVYVPVEGVIGVGGRGRNKDDFIRLNVSQLETTKSVRVVEIMVFVTDEGGLCDHDCGILCLLCVRFFKDQRETLSRDVAEMVVCLFFEH